MNILPADSFAASLDRLSVQVRMKTCAVVRSFETPFGLLRMRGVWGAFGLPATHMRRLRRAFEIPASLMLRREASKHERAAATAGAS